jgi:hypothetical protein
MPYYTKHLERLQAAFGAGGGGGLGTTVATAGFWAPSSI